MTSLIARQQTRTSHGIIADEFLSKHGGFLEAVRSGWAAALEAFGFTMLTMYTHEEHLYAFFVYALPLLALGNKSITRLYWVLSALFGLNLFFFNGFGERCTSPGYWLRTLPGFDLTILVALANILTFAILVSVKGWRFERKYVPPSARNGADRSRSQFRLGLIPA